MASHVLTISPSITNSADRLKGLNEITRTEMIDKIYDIVMNDYITCEIVCISDKYVRNILYKHLGIKKTILAMGVAFAYNRPKTQWRNGSAERDRAPGKRLSIQQITNLKS